MSKRQEGSNKSCYFTSKFDISYHHIRILPLILFSFYDRTKQELLEEAGLKDELRLVDAAVKRSKKAVMFHLFIIISFLEYY